MRVIPYETHYMMIGIARLVRVLSHAHFGTMIFIKADLMIAQFLQRSEHTFITMAVFDPTTSKPLNNSQGFRSKLQFVVNKGSQDIIYSL